MPTPADHRKQFIKTFESLAHRRQRHDVFADFLDLAMTPHSSACSTPVDK